MVDRVDADTGTSLARLPWQADDIDGVTHLDEPLTPGTLAEVAVEEVVDDYDFRASLIRVTLPAGAPERRRSRRELPMSPVTIGSYGR
jgi:ribosomal protein S12 methylthiotransferase